MERLLSNEMSRRILLLKHLYSTSSWITSERLADQLDCSVKTLLQDCQYLEERWAEYLTIETSKKNGIKMITAPHHTLHDIYTEIIKESSAFTLLEAVFSHPNHGSDYFEEKLFMSHSTLYRLIRRINTSLKSRELKLSQHPFYLSGKTERQIRYFFSSYFLEVYGSHSWPFPLEKESILRFIEKINNKQQLHLTNIQAIHMAFSIAVTITREQQGFFIQPEQIDQLKLFKETELLSHYEEDIQTFIRPLSSDPACNWDEDFAYTVFWWHVAWESQEEEERIREMGEGFVGTIQEALGIPITNQSRKKLVLLIENIFALHKMYPFKKYMIYDRFSYSSNSIRQEYVVFTAVVLKALKAMEQAGSIPWRTLYTEEILHYAMIYWEDLPLHLDGLRKTISVVVCTDLGEEHGQFLTTLLENHFKYKISLKTYFYSYLSSENHQLSSGELYVSNFPLEQVPLEQLIIVENIPSAKDLADLQYFIDKARLILPKDIPYLQE